MARKTARSKTPSTAKQGPASKRRGRITRRPRRASTSPDDGARQSPIDQYLDKLTDRQRVPLQSLRRQILAVAKGAEERISYQIAAFRFAGRMLVGFGASANHCTLYLMSTRTAGQFAAELASYQTGKGSIRFSPECPLPAALVRKLVRARIRENASDR